MRPPWAGLHGVAGQRGGEPTSGWAEGISGKVFHAQGGRGATEAESVIRIGEKTYKTVCIQLRSEET